MAQHAKQNSQFHPPTLLWTLSGGGEQKPIDAAQSSTHAANIGLAATAGEAKDYSSAIRSSPRRTSASTPLWSLQLPRAGDRLETCLPRVSAMNIDNPQPPRRSLLPAEAETEARATGMLRSVEEFQSSSGMERDLGGMRAAKAGASRWAIRVQRFLRSWRTAKAFALEDRPNSDRFEGSGGWRPSLLKLPRRKRRTYLATASLCVAFGIGAPFLMQPSKSLVETSDVDSMRTHSATTALLPSSPADASGTIPTQEEFSTGRGNGVSTAEISGTAEGQTTTRPTESIRPNLLPGGTLGRPLLGTSSNVASHRTVAEMQPRGGTVLMRRSQEDFDESYVSHAAGPALRSNGDRGEEQDQPDAHAYPAILKTNRSESRSRRETRGESLAANGEPQQSPSPHVFDAPNVHRHRGVSTDHDLHDRETLQAPEPRRFAHADRESGGDRRAAPRRAPTPQHHHDLDSSHTGIQRASSSRRETTDAPLRQDSWVGGVFDAESVDLLGPQPGLERERVVPASQSSRRLCFRFKDTAWADVLRQYAQAVGLTLRMDVAPQGRVNVNDPRLHSEDEVLQRINQMLAARGFRVVRQDYELIVIPLQRAAIRPDPLSGPNRTLGARQ